MGRLFIVVLAAVGTVWKIDPAMRPYIDVVMLSLVCAFTFYLGDIVAGWLDRWEAKPHWKRQRRARPRYSYYRPTRQSGASMPLLER
jgi:hypothetical protein